VAKTKNRKVNTQPHAGLKLGDRRFSAYYVDGKIVVCRAEVRRDVTGPGLAISYLGFHSAAYGTKSFQTISRWAKTEFAALKQLRDEADNELEEATDQYECVAEAFRKFVKKHPQPLKKKKKRKPKVLRGKSMPPGETMTHRCSLQLRASEHTNRHSPAMRGVLRQRSGKTARPSRIDPAGPARCTLCLTPVFDCVVAGEGRDCQQRRSSWTLRWIQAAGYDLGGDLTGFTEDTMTRRTPDRS
jgi:hypothetical protein